jgi:hypothetical protein
LIGEIRLLPQLLSQTDIQDILFLSRGPSFLLKVSAPRAEAKSKRGWLEYIEEDLSSKMILKTLGRMGLIPRIPRSVFKKILAPY